MEQLIGKSLDFLAATPGDFVRAFIDTIDWSARLIGIKGARGVGKSTLVRQRLSATHTPESAIYMSLDDPYFTDNSFEQALDQLRARGYAHFYLDEVHRLRNWAPVVKNLYDRFPNVSFVFSGSSILDMQDIGADLSRRAVMYEMPGLSFREYLILENIAEIPPIDPDDLFKDHTSLSRTMTKGFTPLQHFHAYLDHGYYPYFKEGVSSYHIKLSQSIRTVVESDMSAIEGYDLSNANVLLKLLYILAGSVPYKPNITLLAKRTGLHANTVVKYLHYLSRARILSFLVAPNKGMSLLQKPDKLYLDNSNLAYALRGSEINIGNVRELFFNNQVRHVAQLQYTTSADFLVNEEYLVEIGGPGKSGTKEDVYIVKDGIDHGTGRTIPLWLFGMLY